MEPITNTGGQSPLQQGIQKILDSVGVPSSLLSMIPGYGKDITELLHGDHQYVHSRVYAAWRVVGALLKADAKNGEFICSECTAITERWAELSSRQNGIGQEHPNRGADVEPHQTVQ